MNTILFKQARKVMDTSTVLGIHNRGGRNYNLKKFVELDEEGIAERERGQFAEREEDEFDVLEEGASLSLEFKFQVFLLNYLFWCSSRSNEGVCGLC